MSGEILTNTLAKTIFVAQNLVKLENLKIGKLNKGHNAPLYSFTQLNSVQINNFKENPSKFLVEDIIRLLARVKSPPSQVLLLQKLSIQQEVSVLRFWGFWHLLLYSSIVIGV